MATDRLATLTRRIQRLTDTRNALAVERVSVARERSEQGWSLQRIADAAGVKKATVQGWLRE